MNYSGPSDNDRSGAPERAVGAALIAVTVAALLSWVLADRGAGLLQVFLVAWLVGNLMFLGVLGVFSYLVRAIKRRSAVDGNSLRNAGG